MGIDQIAANLQALNAATPVKLTKKPAAAKKTNGHTHLNPEEQLRFAAERIVAALGLQSQGVSADNIIASVKSYEHYDGAVQ